MKSKTVFFCTECGAEVYKWTGRCAACGSWNTMVEAPAEAPARGASAGTSLREPPERITELDTQEELRFPTGLSELDRVLGGGAVRGSLILVGGAPGIGKSTLLLQICGRLAGERILYVTGEESRRQLKLRAQRLGVESENLFVLAETDLDAAISAITTLAPDILIVDSIQTMFHAAITSSPGSVSQVKDCTMAIMQLAKSQGFTAFVVGHVNKEGAIAGPKVLEHMVDCVLCFEGDRNQSYRILRAEKNRFGSTNEIGVFEMADDGLREVENPSEMLLSGRPENVPGSCVTCVIEGTRPLLAEVQSLVSPSNINVARRNANGIDYNRALLLLAVLEKRGGLAISGCDVYINVVGGLRLDEPAADLATILAIASSHRDRPTDGRLAAVGEVGLTGEIRSVSGLSKRLAEIARLGFTKCVLPAVALDGCVPPSGLDLIPVRSVRQAIAAVLTE